MKFKDVIVLPVIVFKDVIVLSLMLEGETY